MGAGVGVGDVLGGEFGWCWRAPREGEGKERLRR